MVAGPAAACPLPSVGLDAGIGFAPTPLSAAEPFAAGNVVAGWNLHQCLGWPLRVELTAGSGTRGPPWYQGVEAVAVLSWSVDLNLIAGPTYELWRNDAGDMGLGSELLVGPDLRITGVRHRVRDDEDDATAAFGLGRVLAGFFFRLDAFRFHLRGDWIFPEDGALLLGFAYQM
jgi:hypothetical protein